MKKQVSVRKPKQTYFELIEVRDARPLEGFRAHVVFTDDTERDIDLEPYLHGPVFEPIRSNPEMFRAMRIEGGTIAWANEADIAPETLYYGDQDPPWVKARVQVKAKSRRGNARKSTTATNGKGLPVKHKVGANQVSPRKRMSAKPQT